MLWCKCGAPYSFGTPRKILIISTDFLSDGTKTSATLLPGASILSFEPEGATNRCGCSEKKIMLKILLSSKYYPTNTRLKTLFKGLCCSGTKRNN